MATSARDMQQILQEFTDEQRQEATNGINAALLETNPNAHTSGTLQIGIPSPFPMGTYNLLPLISSAVFSIDLRHLKINNRSLYNIITDKCNHNEIVGEVPPHAQGTAVIVALAGKKPKGANTALQSEYAPFYKTELKKPFQRVLVISIRGASILIDNLDVTDSLPISGRQNLLFRNFTAVEGEEPDIIITAEYTSPKADSEKKQAVNVANTPAIIESKTPRTLGNIAIYFLSPQIICGPTDKITQINHMCELSQQLANQYRLPTFIEFTDYINSLVQEVLREKQETQAVSVKSDIFEHTLLHLAGVRKLPSSLSFHAVPDPRGFVLALHNSSQELQKQVIAGLNDAFGGKHAFFMPNNQPGDPRLYIFIPYSSIYKHAIIIKKALNTLFSEPRKLATYAAHTNKRLPAHDNLVQEWSNHLYLKHRIIPGRNKASLPILLLKAFGWDEIPNEPKLLKSNGYFSEMFDSALTATNMTPEVAQQIVDAINEQCPSETSPCAHIVKSANSSTIILNAEQLLRAAGLMNFLETRISQIKQNDPLWFNNLNEEFRAKKPWFECNEILSPLIRKYLSCKSQEEIQLGTHLQNFLRQLVRPDQMEELRRVSFAVTTSIALLESTLEPQALEAFKKADKAAIKSLQSEFGVRKTVTAKTEVAVVDLNQLGQQYEQSTTPEERQFGTNLCFFMQTLAEPGCSRDMHETASVQLTRSMARLESTHKQAEETRFFKTRVKSQVKAVQKELAERITTSERQISMA